MVAKCKDCGKIKRGCKTVTWVCPGYNTYVGYNPLMYYMLGKPACRSCLNFRRRELAGDTCMNSTHVDARRIPLYDIRSHS